MKSTLLAPVLLAAAGTALLGVSSCRSGERGAEKEPSGEAADAPHKGDNELIKGPFANAVQVSERGFMLEDKGPPPRDQDATSISIDGDDDEGDARPARGGGGSGRKRFGQSPLYVDGVPVAVVAYGELPAWLPTRQVTLGDGRKATRFLLAEYLEALEIPVDKIRELHLYGGRGRVAVMGGDELRRVRRELLFSFTAGNAGKMRMHWDGKLEVSDTIDKVQGVSIYVAKSPPKWDRAKWGLVDDKGQVYEGVPYVAEPLRGGVRLYLDGRIVHVLKRNQTFNRKVAPHRIVDGVPFFRLFEYLEEEGIDATSIAALELLTENKVALRLDPKALAEVGEGMEMSAPPGSGGSVSVHLGPAGAGVRRRSLPVTSIQFYSAKRARQTHHRRD
jgi:hypothetical protein